MILSDKYGTGMVQYVITLRGIVLMYILNPNMGAQVKLNFSLYSCYTVEGRLN
jgi:hypothetical protein